MVFSLLTSVLAGWFAAGVFAGTGRRPPDPILFLVLALVAAGSSTLHLGRPLRAYRAVLNWRRSWLSREILLFSAFVGAALLELVVRAGGPVAWSAASLGFASLFAIDRVYAVTATQGLARHSARALLTGALVLAVLLGSSLLLAVFGGLKLGLYVHRKLARSRSGLDARPGWGAVRVLALVLGGALALGSLPALDWPGLLCLALGEIIDRCEFYVELEISTPRRQMALDLAQDLESLPADVHA